MVGAVGTTLSASVVGSTPLTQQFLFQFSKNKSLKGVITSRTTQTVKSETLDIIKLALWCQAAIAKQSVSR
jgi:hypothetical protein